MNFNEFKELVVAAAKEQGVAEYELYYSSSESTSASTFRHEINEFTSAFDGGVCFRCIVDGKMGYASTEELSESEAARIVRSAAENARILESEEKVFLGKGGEAYEPLDLTPYALPDVEKMTETALAADRALYAEDAAVIDGTGASVSCETRHVAIYNSNGLDLSCENNLAVTVVMPVVSDGGEMADSYEMKAGSLDSLDLNELVAKAVSSAKSKLGASVAPTGAYPVVFAPKAMCSLLSTFYGVFSSENTQKGLSRLGGSEGKKIASDAVTLVDDPFYPESAMPINFDAEGSPTHTKNVIENGVLKTLLYNLKTAAAAGVKTTANASKASYAAEVAVRPFTMYLAPGSLTEDELLKKAGSGVYITSLGGLHAGANAISGDFSLQSSGYMIENGEKAGAVKSFTVAGNFYSLLGQITALSDKVELSGFSITSFGSPAVLVEGLTIAGK